jgi:hypothetical protein
MKKNLLASFSIFLLNSCTPVIIGTSPGNPINANQNNPIRELQPGATWYIVGNYFFQDFGYENPDVNEAATALEDAEIISIDSPEGWQIKASDIYKQERDVYIDAISSNTKVPVGLRIDYVVTIPKLTTEGMYEVVTNVKHKQKIYSLILILQVAKS